MATSIANTKEMGTMKVAIARNGARKARIAEIFLRAGLVEIHPPQAINQIGEPLFVNIVVAKETNPPDGAAPLGWVLLSTESVDTLPECVQVVDHYQGRWTIAMLGGFLGRKHDGNPGWITLMTGYEKLLTLEQGYILAMIDVGK